MSLPSTSLQNEASNNDVKRPSQRLNEMMHAACNPEGRNVESKETTETSWRIYHIDVDLSST